MNKKTLKRMLALSDIKPINESTNSLSSIELVKKAPSNKVYAIIRENSSYYIKSSDKVNNLTESDFNFIGGVGNKPKYSHKSFESATRQLNLMIENVGDILQSDDNLLQEKKFVLKQPKAKIKPQAEPEFDFGGEDSFDFSADTGSDEDSGTDTGEFDFSDDGIESEEGFDGEGDEGGDMDIDFDNEDDVSDDVSDDELNAMDLDSEESDDPIKDIQKTTGTLGQQIRDTEDITSDMQKWVAKSVLSALDLDGMDNSDKKDLINTIKTKKTEEEPAEIETDDFTDGFEDDTSGEDYDTNMSDNYDSYMDDDDDEGKCPSCGGTGCSNCAGLGYVDEVPMSDIDMGIEDKAYLNIDPESMNKEYDSYMGEDSPHIGGDEDDEKLLFDNELEDITNPEAMNRANRDMSKHYNRPAAPGYEDKGTENWRGHRLPDDTEFNLDNEYNSYMGDEFDSIEAELGLPPATSDIDRTDYGNTRLDNSSNFDETSNSNRKSKYDTYMRDENDPTMSPGPAPARPAPTKEPGTKPGKPDTDRPARPSKRPFTPPPHITPGEEPGPKADWDDDGIEFS